MRIRPPVVAVDRKGLRWFALREGLVRGGKNEVSGLRFSVRIGSDWALTGLAPH